MLTPERRQMRGRVSWMMLYGEPLVILVAAMSVALILAVVLRPPTTNQGTSIPSGTPLAGIARAWIRIWGIPCEWALVTT